MFYLTLRYQCPWMFVKPPNWTIFVDLLNANSMINRSQQRIIECSRCHQMRWFCSTGAVNTNCQMYIPPMYVATWSVELLFTKAVDCLLGPLADTTTKCMPPNDCSMIDFPKTIDKLFEYWRFVWSLTSCRIMFVLTMKRIIINR